MKREVTLYISKQVESMLKHLPNIDLDVLDKTDGKTEAHLKL